MTWWMKKRLMAATSTMSFWVLEGRTLILPSQVISIMPCATRESRPSFSHIKFKMKMMRNFNFQLLLSRQFRNQGFLLLFSQKTMQPPHVASTNLWSSLSVWRWKNSLFGQSFMKYVPRILSIREVRTVGLAMPCWS